MDFLQAALIFLILVLSILLSIIGFYVFLILKDLKKALDRLNKVLDVGEGAANVASAKKNQDLNYPKNVSLKNPAKQVQYPHDSQ